MEFHEQKFNFMSIYLIFCLNLARMAVGIATAACAVAFQDHFLISPGASGAHVNQLIGKG